MAKKQREEPNTSEWMNTYSDLVTLLLCFFVLLFSMSTINAEKWENFVKAFANPGDKTMQVVIDALEDKGDELANPMGESTPAQSDSMPRTDLELPASFDELYEYMKSYAEENGLSESVQVSKGKNTVYIRFKNNLFFDPDSSNIRQAAFPVLDFLGDCLHSVQDEIMTININGHTASVANAEWYAVSDWRLSSERASEIAIYFEENGEVEPTIMRPIGYGKNYPVESNDTTEGREANRRVDMVIVSKNAALSPDDPMYQELVGLFDPGAFPSSASADEILVPQDAFEALAQQTALDAGLDADDLIAAAPDNTPETSPEAEPGGIGVSPEPPAPPDGETTE